VRLTKADVLIEGGAGLEAGWLPGLVQRAGNRRILPGGQGRIQANAGIEMLEVPTTLDRSRGDIHAAGNPHFLVDPVNARTFAQNVGDAFARIDPANADVYRANATKFIRALDGKIPEWRKALEPFKGETIVGYHNSWPYFARRFEFKIDLFLEPKPGLPPSPAHLAQVIEQMKQRNARVIIVDRYLDRRTAETIAKRTRARTVEVSHYPGGVKGTEGGYIPLLDYLVRSLREALATRK
jgi:zinc/manganese transport system substrate-binding protein